MAARLATVALNDKYTLESGRIYVTGTQALARLPFIQKRRDERAGFNTAGYISGYRGSPLGNLDQALWQAKRIVEQRAIVFRPGVNEDLAATAIWGTQQVNAFEGAKYDGVFSMWYGKGPGVDRSGDVFKHGNAAGSSRYGGVLLVAGDDHAAKSSTLPHQSDYAFMDAGIPVLSPAGVQEYADFGVFGWALSRFSGCWVGFKAVTSAIDSSASIEAATACDLAFVEPENFKMPAGGLNLRLSDDWWEPEARLYHYKLPAAQVFANANKLDRVVMEGGSRPRLGIITAGKAYLDLLEALAQLGITAPLAAQLGLKIFKVGLVWPLDPRALRSFAEGLEEILVVEEKRPLLEAQVKEHLYNQQTFGTGIRVVGKSDENGSPQLPIVGELDPLRLALVIGKRLARQAQVSEEMRARLAALEVAARRGAPNVAEILKRPPHFCSGCPHNSSTKVPEGSWAGAGIGCHIMARLMERNTIGFTQMGGEGAQWVGMAPFTSVPHFFQNLGDGTYFHSGLLAIRQAVAANVNITYKILFNDGVAMTGGQPVDGNLTVPGIVQQVAAEGVQRVVVVSDEPDKYPSGTFAPNIKIHHRDEMDLVQRRLRDIEGVSILIYDQTCAAEKRRRRKRGSLSDPAKHTVINDLVCEGCGDCSVQSNCLSVVPIETEYGTKRTIDQSSCNKDFSCLNGFCPSFVTVHGGTLRQRQQIGGEGEIAVLPEPTRPEAGDQPYNIVITGVGGTGVVTIGALLGMAAHLEGRGVSVLDMTGAAQKGGAVFTHVRIAREPSAVHAARIMDGAANLILGCDMVVTATTEVLGRAARSKTRAVLNQFETVTAEFTRHSPAYRFPGEELRRRIAAAIGPDLTESIDAGRLATALLGDSIGVNLFMLGYAWQKGFVPLSAQALAHAIELNGVAVEFNKRAFEWGRYAAHDRDAVERAAKKDIPTADHHRVSETLDEIIARRVRYLTDYQNAAYAARYERLVRRVSKEEAARMDGCTGITGAVAKSFFKLMSYKDEYEVARLYTRNDFLERLDEMFEGNWRPKIYLAPPLFAARDARTGHLRKQAYGRWIFSFFRLLAPLRILRGTPFDPFGYTKERRGERRLIGDYEATMSEVISKLNNENQSVAIEIAEIPDLIRGYGHVKEGNLKRSKAREAELLAMFRSSYEARAAAA